jgi:single-strand DNA-binding protein
MYQRITIVGNLGGDPTMKFLPNGDPVTNFSVATNRRWTGSDGQQQEETTWFRVSAWGRLAETCNEYLSTGRQVLVEGRLRPDDDGNPRTWIGNDGAARASFEVTAQTVQFLGGHSGPHGSQKQAESEDESEIPF